MTRGKHGQRAKNRRAAQHRARVEELHAEIAAEQEALAAVEAEAAAVDVVRADLGLETEARTGDTASRLEQLKAEADFLTAAVREQKNRADAVSREWERVNTSAIDAFGGGREGFEKVMAIIRHGGILNDIQGVDARGAATIQRARGQRRRVGDFPDAAPLLTDVLWGTLRYRHEQTRTLAGVPVGEDLPDPVTAEHQQAIDAVEDVAKRVWVSHAGTLSVDALHAWHPLPWLRPWFGEEQVGLTADLGVPGTYKLADPPGAGSAADEWPIATAALPAATRHRLAATSPDALVEQWQDKLRTGEALNRILGPHARDYVAGPRHPRPGRAAALRHTYAKAAIGTWSRTHEAAVYGEEPDTSPDAGPDTGPGAAATLDDARVCGELAVGLTAGAAYWLPTGQVHPFADSEPLSEEDLPELLLPFPQVFLAFAEPLDLPARRPASRREERVLADLDLAVADLIRKDGPTYEDVLTNPDTPESIGALPVDQVVATRGARVEGLLLLADSLGRPEDTFAWCLSVPSGANGTLGRHVVAASLAETRYRHVVENLTAVLAWADWHEPDVETTIPPGTRVADIVDLLDTPAFKRDADRAGGGGVRVLNVRSTVRTSGSSDGTGRHVAPHVRRGHWRRQRFGPGAKQVRRIRIAPVVVNAHLGPEGLSRVYVLPTGEGH